MITERCFLFCFFDVFESRCYSYSKYKLFLLGTMMKKNITFLLLLSVSAHIFGGDFIALQGKQAVSAPVLAQPIERHASAPREVQDFISAAAARAATAHKKPRTVEELQEAMLADALDYLHNAQYKKHFRYIDLPNGWIQVDIRSHCDMSNCCPPIVKMTHMEECVWAEDRLLKFGDLERRQEKEEAELKKQLEKAQRQRELAKRNTLPLKFKGAVLKKAANQKGSVIVRKMPEKESALLKLYLK